MTAWPDQNDTPEHDHSLASIMAFLGGEIDYSLTMLRDLATCLSDVIHTFDETSDTRTCINRTMEALQSEDRIQQRLADLRSTILVLEHMLQAGTQPPAVDLDRAIIDQLRLDEMRDAYAARVGMSGHEVTGTTAVDVPSAGDVDLF